MNRTRTDYRRLGAVICSVLPCVMGCARNRIEPKVATIFRITQDSVALERTPYVTSFRVTAVIRNNGSTPLVFGGCGPDAQRNISGTWTTVWSPICFSQQTATVMPGDSITLPLIVAAFIKPNIEPQLDPRMGPGTYRLRFGVAYQDTSIQAPPRSLEILESHPFLVYERARR